MSPRAPLFAFALLASLNLPAVIPQAGAATFKWANDGDVRAMDPYTLDETVQNSFLSNIYEGLVRRNKKLEPEPALATSWEQTAPTTWRFHLRQGVKWQDGSPFTAADVLFSFKRINGKNSQYSPEVHSIKDIHKVDEATLDVETIGPDPILPSEMASFPIMSEAWCTEHNSVENVVVGSGENYALRNAMGTGPFRLTLREPDRRNVLEPNPNWWDKPEHNLDRVEFTIISSAPTRVAALLTGEVDMIYSVPTQDIDKISHAPGIKLIQGPELRTIYLGMDQVRDELLYSNVKGKNPFKDLRVRQAFSLAIDEAAIAQRVMRGNARPTWLMWGPGVNGFDPKMNQRPAVDLVKAKALLAEAGYPDGFEVTIDCPNDRYVNDEAICTAVSAMMARVGVKVNVYARTKSKFFADTGYPNYNTSFFLSGWTPATYDAQNVIQAILHTRGKGVGLNNGSGFTNARVDQLNDLIAVELDKAKRDAMIDEAAKIVQDQVGFIPLHQQTIVWAAKENIDLTQPADNSFPMRWVRVK
jgi:peptide/nickel transport system substrate-binding protein